MNAATIRPFLVSDYRAARALWERTEGLGLNESDTQAGIAQRNPAMSAIARALLDFCCARLAGSGIPRCNIFLYRDNESGASFWSHHGCGEQTWVVRPKRLTLPDESHPR